jgi:radical SAM superfamily enzyme YgiQ (UPF0313 family)
MTRNNNIKKLLLVFPSSNPDFKGNDIEFEIPAIPIGVMSLAAFMIDNGIDVKLIDARVCTKEDTEKTIFSEIQQSNHKLMVGFSVTTSQVKHAYILSKGIKKKFPDVPIVWGGIHATLYPNQTVNSIYVDFVIVGEGEYGLLELIRQLNSSRPDFSKVGNLVYNYRNKIFMNKEDSIMDINALPMPAYNLLDIERYIDREIYFYGLNKKVKAMDINTSRGCPYRCSFCTNTLSGFRNWRPLNVEHVNKLVDNIIHKYNINHIWFMDDYFFGNKERVKKILEHIIVKKYKITWEGNARANLFTTNYFDDEMLLLMKKSGCIQLRMGIESGSEKVLKILKKDITLKDIIRAVQTCKKWDIGCVLTFMGGIPGENKEDFNKTIDLIVKLKSIHQDAIIMGPGLFRPYPGTELYKECKKGGFKEPKSLKSWIEIDLTNNYSITEKDIRWTNFAMDVVNADIIVFNFVYGYTYVKKKKKMGLARIVLYYLAKFRLRFHFYKFPIEKKLFELKKYFERRFNRKIL